MLLCAWRAARLCLQQNSNVVVLPVAHGLLFLLRVANALPLHPHTSQLSP